MSIQNIWSLTYLQNRKTIPVIKQLTIGFASARTEPSVWPPPSSLAVPARPELLTVTKSIQPWYHSSNKFVRQKSNLAKANIGILLKLKILLLRLLHVQFLLEISIPSHAWLRKKSESTPALRLRDHLYSRAVREKWIKSGVAESVVRTQRVVYVGGGQAPYYRRSGGELRFVFHLQLAIVVEPHLQCLLLACVWLLVIAWFVSYDA